MSKLKVIYLCAKDHRFDESFLNELGLEVYYNDICRGDLSVKAPDFLCDALDVELQPYDLLLATPPCNYWSCANYRRATSYVAQSTKHLLPSILNMFLATGKPFFVENVQNWGLFERELLPLLNGEDYQVSFRFKHTYWHKHICPLLPFGYFPKQNKQAMAYGHRDNNDSVHFYFEYVLTEFSNLYREVD